MQLYPKVGRTNDVYALCYTQVLLAVMFRQTMMVRRQQSGTTFFAVTEPWSSRHFLVLRHHKDCGTTTHGTSSLNDSSGVQFMGPQRYNGDLHSAFVVDVNTTAYNNSYGCRHSNSNR